jgi:tripartite-type tricarboxylate transporter receptor subunit TctC
MKISLNFLPRLCAVLVFALSPALTVARDASTYPDGPIKIVVGFVPGGPTDLYGRLTARVLSDAFGQQVVVENRPGGSGAIAAKGVAGTEPDGYNLLVNVVADLITPLINKKAGYNLQTSFTPIGLIASSPNVLVAGPGTPVDSLAGLIALARKNPGTLSYASAGTATVSHLAGALLASEAGLTMTHIPYKGTAGAQVDLLAGRVSIIFDNLPNGLANAKLGRVKALAVTSAQRWPSAPDLPTVAESGYPGATILSTFGLMAPAGTPVIVVNKLAAALQKGLQDEKVRKSITDSGSEPGALGPKEYAAYIADESKRWVRFLEKHPEITIE